MFSSSAAWYDELHAAKDYAAEADLIASLVERFCPGASRLLDVGCGSGRHLGHLAGRFACEGTDIDESLLGVARSKLPEMPFTCADMAELDLGRTFDAVVCLFSAIGYVLTVERLRRSVAAMARHLDPGGVVIVEPWILPEDWQEGGRTDVTTVEKPDRALIRVVTSLREDRLTRLRMHYVVAGGGTIETADEEHRLTMFTRQEYLDAFTAAGLQPSWLNGGPTGRGLLVGVQASRF